MPAVIRHQFAVPTPPLTVVYVPRCRLKMRIRRRNARCRIKGASAAAKLNRPDALIGRPDVGAPAGQAQRPASTFTVPVLLNSRADRRGRCGAGLLEDTKVVHHRRAPLSALPRLTALIVNPLLGGLIIERCSATIVSMPEPGSLTLVFGLALFRLIETVVPRRRAGAAQLQRPTTIQPKTVELNAAPPCASVVPDPLCVPPDKVDSTRSPSPSQCR